MKALIQICSARNVPAASKLNTMVRLEFLGDYKETVVKKNCGDRPIWNQTLSFVIPPGDLDQHELKVKCLSVVAKRRTELGSAALTLSSQPSELLDTWLNLSDKAGVQSISVHLCVQVEPIFKDRPIAALPPVDLNEEPAADGAASLLRQRARSDFEGHAAAVSVNEVIESLERVQLIINQPRSSVADLQNASQLLVQAREQIALLDIDSEEDRSKFDTLAAQYERICKDMISKQSWNAVTERAARSDGQPKRVTSGDYWETAPSLREHFITSLENFDLFMDRGYVVEKWLSSSLASAPAGTPARPGDFCVARIVGYVYDGTTMQAVKYTSFTLEAVLGLPPDFCPKGLDCGLCGLAAGERATISVTPAMGFGDLGSDEVPPNSNLVFDVYVVRIDPPPSSMMAELDFFAEADQASPLGDEFIDLSAFNRRSADLRTQVGPPLGDEFVDFTALNRRSVDRKSQRAVSQRLSQRMGVSVRLGGGANPFDDEALVAVEQTQPPPVIVTSSATSSSFTTTPATQAHVVVPPRPIPSPHSPTTPPPPPVVVATSAGERPLSPKSRAPRLHSDLRDWLTQFGMMSFAPRLTEIGVVSLDLLAKVDLMPYEDLRPLIFAQQLLNRDFELL